MGLRKAIGKIFSPVAKLLGINPIVALVASLFLFAKVNFYGFIIGLTSVVIIIIGKNLKDQA